MVLRWLVPRSSADKSATPSYPSVFSRVSFAAEWMQETICNMTGDPESQSLYCPFLRCPADEQILGFPQAVIPDRAANVSSNYRIADVLQSPPSGAFVSPNSSTVVTITARTASTNANLSCTFRVNVGPVEYLGETTFDISASNLKKKQRKSLGVNKYPGAKGCVHRVDMTLNSKLLGQGAKISNQIVIGSKSYKLSTLVAGRTTTKASISPCVSFANTQTLNVGLNSTNVVLPGSALKRKYVVKVKLYGQKV
jgi:hypothetical protein